MADGTVTIDVLMGTKSFMSDRERVNNLMKTLGSDAGNQMDEAFAKNSEKVKTSAEQTHKKVKKEFSDPVVAKLEAKANAAGVKDFKSLLTRIPRNQLTRLEAKSEHGDVIDWEREISRIPKKKQTNLKVDAAQAKTELDEVQDKASDVKKSFSDLKSVFAGSFLGNIAASGIGMASGALGNVMSSAIDASDAIDKFDSTMGFADFGKDKIQSTSKEVQKYANDTVYELGDVSNTTAQLAANGIKNYMGLTESAGNLNAVAGGNADTFKSVAMMLTQTAGAGKLTTENWNQLADAIPGASGKLQEQMKKNGAFTGNFRDAMAAGKISSEEFSKAINQLGQQDGAIKAAKSTKTFEGAVGNLEAAVVTDIQEVISIIGKGNITGAINGITDSFTGLLGYLKSHKSTLIDVFKNLKNIAGTIGGTIWKTFSGVVYDIASFFGLISDKAKKSKDPIDKIDSALKNLSKNKELIEDLTKAFIAMFALKKGIEFIGMLSSLRKSLIETAAVSKMVDLFGGGGGVAGAGGKAVTRTVAKEAGGAAATAGSSKVLGRLFSKGGATSTAELEAASGLGGGKAMMAARGLTKAVPYLSIAASVPELFGTTKKTLGKHLGGFAGSAGGTAAGAAAGSAVMPVVGTAVGGVIGGFAGSKLGQSIGGSIQKGVTKTFPKLTSKMSDLGHDMSKKFSGSFKPKPSLNDKQFSRSYTSLTKTLNKQAKIKIKTDTSSISKAQKLTDTTYGKMKKSVDKYYGNKRRMSIKDYATLVQNGSMTEKEANRLLNKAKENYNKQAKAQKDNIGKMKKDSDNYYSKLGKAESQKNKELAAARKKDGNNHKKYLADKKRIEKDFQKRTAGDRKKYLAQLAKDENKSNNAVTKATKISSGKQLDILENLKDHKGKLSKKQMTETIRNSAKERDKTINNADKQRDKSVSAARKKYKETVAAADKERYENGTMSRKQYEAVVSKARKQRDDSIDAADSQKKKTVKKAKETHTKVVDEATKQAGEHKGAVDGETGDVKGSWNEFIDNMRGMWNGMIGGINGVLHALNKKWGNIPTWKKHAAGLNGSMGEHTALVGEEGFEYMGTSNGSIMPIGVDGPEIRNIPAGASILPHGMSVEFAQMAKGLPGYKIGLPGWLTSTFSALKKGAEGAVDLVSEGASGVVNKIANATGLGKLAKTFNDNTTAFGAIASGAKDSLIDNAIKYVQGFFDQFSDTSDDGAGSLAPHFGSPFKVSSGYGPRAGGFHKGIDFAAPLGTPIPAQYGGTVVQAGPASGFGNWVVIKPSGASVDTIYGHMKRMKVKTGQHVKAGQIIAWVGSEGQSSGPHVHYELRAGLGGKSYNPMTYGASAGGHYNPSLITTAARMMGIKSLPSGFSQLLQGTIMSESGGKSVIQTVHDRNSGGNEAGGILQFTPGTFNAFAMPGHKKRMNPLDSLLAFFNNSDWRNSIGHTSILGIPKIDWLHSGPQGHRRFANGGWGDSDKVNIFNEVPGEPEVAINPARDSADSLIVEAARARAAKAPNGLVAKAMRVVGAAKAGIQRTAPSFASRGVAEAEGQAAGNQAIGGNMTISVQLDSNTIARATYPKISILRNQEIQLKGQTTGNTYAY